LRLQEIAGGGEVVVDVRAGDRVDDAPTGVVNETGENGEIGVAVPGFQPIELLPFAELGVGDFFQELVDVGAAAAAGELQG